MPNASEQPQTWARPPVEMRIKWKTPGQACEKAVALRGKVAVQQSGGAAKTLEDEITLGRRYLLLCGSTRIW